MHNQAAVEAALTCWREAYGLALVMLGDAGRAEDLCQEAYLRLASMPRPVTDSERVKPLLLQVEKMVFDVNLTGVSLLRIRLELAAVNPGLNDATFGHGAWVPEGTPRGPETGDERGRVSGRPDREGRRRSGRPRPEVTAGGKPVFHQATEK